MSSSQLPNTAIPKPLPEDDDDVSWALQTAAVQWGRGACQDAIVWLRRAAESAIELEAWSRAADLNATASRLEKQLSKQGSPTGAPVPSGMPSAPPRAAILPSFPVPNTAAPPAVAGHLAGTRRQTTGYSSFPPLATHASQHPSNSARSSVVIDVEEGELELSDEEIRELESAAAPATDIPTGARPSYPSWPASGAIRPSVPGDQRGGLPAFDLESAKSNPPNMSLPAFPLDAPDTPPSRPSVASGREIGGASRSPGQPGAALPSFPLDPSASSLPPVSKWPRLGSPGTSHLPPNPGLPAFETVPPSRPFVDDGDDGAPGLGDLALVEEGPVRDLEPPSLPAGLQLIATSTAPPPPRPSPDDHLELQELEGPRSSRKPPVVPKPLVQLPSRPARSSARPKLGSPPLPPATSSGLRRAREATPLPASKSRHSSTPVGGLRDSALPHSIEPRMPKRTLSSRVGPLDFREKAESSTPPERRLSATPSSDSYGSPPPSSRRASVPRLLDAQDLPTVAPPPSARSVEPEDLPTVSSPSLSRPPPALELESPDIGECPATDRPGSDEVATDRPILGPTPGDTPEARLPVFDTAEPEAVAPDLPASERPAVEARNRDRRSGSVGPAERRRINFKFEEPKGSTRSPSVSPNLAEMGRSHSPSSVSERARPEPGFAGEYELAPAMVAEPVVEEALASLPPVVTRPSRETAAPVIEDVLISGVRLADVRGFSDLPASAHRLLAKTARIEALASGEEASFFSVALVLDGWVGLMPAIADTACATAVVGEVVFTEGTLADGLMLRVVAGQDDVVVATWDSEAIHEATRDCPWVADDLRLLADGFQALAGACLGPLGDRLDDSLRSIVTSRCEIRTLLAGEQLCAANKIVPGMHIIGGGEVELVDENGRVARTHGTGEFLFAPQVLAGGVAPYAARAGSKGALVLFAPRMAAHELLVGVPPLLEILAE